MAVPAQRDRPRRGKPATKWSRKSRKVLFRTYLFIPAKSVGVKEIAQLLRKLGVDIKYQIMPQIHSFGRDFGV